MRGLLMVEPLYHQTVAGLKTQTRRDGGLDEVNGRGASKTKPAIETDPDEWLIDEVDTGAAIPWVSFNGENTGDPKPIISVTFRKKNTHLNWPPVCKPRYKVGEVLFIKEPTWTGEVVKGNGEVTLYKYDDQSEYLGKILKWGNKMFMPASLAREYVKITGIKCERLLDISDDDAVSEGIEKLEGTDLWKYYKKIHDNCNGTPSPRRSFFTLFTFANKIKDSDAMPNPWVWVYSFEYLKNYKA